MPKIRSVSKIKESLLRPALTSFFEVEIPFPQADLGLSAFIGQDQDNLNLRCTNASLPGSNLATLELNNTFHGVTQRHAYRSCLLYTSPSPRDGLLSRMPSSA